MLLYTDHTDHTDDIQHVISGAPKNKTKVVNNAPLSHFFIFFLQLLHFFTLLFAPSSLLFLPPHMMGGCKTTFQCYLVSKSFRIRKKTVFHRLCRMCYRRTDQPMDQWTNRPRPHIEIRGRISKCYIPFSALGIASDLVSYFCYRN